jgi:hypothetical protein
MLYYVKRPSSLTEPFPVFTRLGGLSKSKAGCEHRARACMGRVYSTDGHRTELVADFYAEPVPVVPLKGAAYWAARAQAAVFS